jgi:hypothetical protein
VTAVAFPDGVASPDGTVGFIELRSGGVRALELRSGADLWTVTAPARPRLVVGDRLVAEDLTQSRGHTLSFLTLDLARGGAVDRRIGPIVLPDWVAVADPEQTFQYDVKAHGAQMTIEWRAESHYAGGAPPPPHLEAQSRREARGSVSVDLGSGRIVHDTAVPTNGPPAISPEDTAASPSTADVTALARVMPADAHSPCVVHGRGFYLIEPARATAGEPRLICVDPHTGKTFWERTLPGRPKAAPSARRL